jgi:hypothetical protein
MTASIVIQHQEDHPRNPGWWRFSRPRCEVCDQAPPISERQRWYYGSPADAARDAAEWDRCHPRG